MFNVQQTISRLADMSDAQLAQYARMHKDDPYTLSLTASEYKRRKQLRQNGQAQQGGPQPTVADQEVAAMEQDALPEDQGIGVLPAQNIATMADGGIAGYAEGGPVSFAEGGTKKSEKFDPDAYLQNPNVQKFLQYLNVYEGAPKANHLVGFKEFQGFDDHPRTPVVFNKKGATSTAAGLFQIKGDTWDYQRKKLGLKDFSPDNQKRAAIGILKDIKALPDIVAGNFDAAKEKAAKQWASLPGSTIGKATGQIPRYKSEAEAILEQPVQQAQNQPAPTPAPKEKSLKQRVFDLLPFSSAGAAASPTAKTKGQSYEPIDEDFYARLAAAEAAYEKRFGKPMPVTSRGRTRYEQQKLYDDWKAGKKNIHMPVNPADYPGREVFHLNAVDISAAVPETFLNEFGLKRPFGKKDPVHAVAVKDWKPSAATRMAVDATKTEPKPAPARVTEQAAPSAAIPAQRADVTAQPAPVVQSRVTQAAPRVQSTPSTHAQNNVGLPSIISSAQAANTPAPPSAATGRSSDFAPENTSVPITYPPAPEVAEYINRLRAYEADQQRRRDQEAAKNKKPSKAVPSLKQKDTPKAKADDDVVYSPEGVAVYGGAPYADTRTKPPAANTVVAQTPTAAPTPDLRFKDVPGSPDAIEYEKRLRAETPRPSWLEQRGQELLGAPEALLSATTGALSIPAAPVVAAGRTMMGTPTTVEEAMEDLTFVPRSEAGKTSLSELHKALVEDYKIPPFIPGFGSARNVPKAGPRITEAEAAAARAAEARQAAKTSELPGIEGPKPTETPDLAATVRQRFAEAQERAAQAAEAAGDVDKAARLRESIKTPKEYSLSPEAKEAGIQALLERRRREQATDVRKAKEAAEIAERSAAEAEGIAGIERKMDAGDAALAMARSQAEARRNIFAPAVVGSTAANEAAPSAPGASEADVNAQFNAAYKYGDRYVPDAIAEAKKVAEQVMVPPPAAETPTPKTSGFSNEDILTMGLNMMMAPAGQPGGGLSQLLGNVGRSGIATLQAKREREKLAQEQTFKDLYGKYIGKQTEMMGREPEDIRSLDILSKRPDLMRTLARKQIANDITGAQTRLIGEFQKARMLNPTLSWDEFLKGVPEEYLPGGGVGFGMPQGVTVTRSGT